MKSKNKFSVNFFSIENIIRGIVVIGLILFASSKYELMNILEGLGVILGMTLTGASMVRIYQEILDYLKIGSWTLSLLKTLMYLSVIILISLLFVLLLPIKIVIWSFSSLGVILVLLLIYDRIGFLIKKLF